MIQKRNRLLGLLIKKLKIKYKINFIHQSIPQVINIQIHIISKEDFQ